MMKILTLSSLFPNKEQASHGIFVENRLRHVLATGEVEAKVIAPVPWFPFPQARFGQYGTYARVPYQEQRYNLDITHPRHIVIPKVGMNIAPWLMYKALKPQVAALIKSGFDFDLIDAHFFYPDGVAAAMLARDFNKPFIVTARGTDINLIPEYENPRKQILWAASQSSGMITVCKALKDRLVELGVPDERVRVLRNGVDLEMFSPLNDREAARKELGITGTTLVSVGHLIERKGNHLTIEALKQVPDVTLMLVGDGPEENRLKKQVKELGLEERVRFMGRQPHDQLKKYYGAADVSILSSSREGWANVLLESMACGTPVVATDIWGTAEVVASEDGGVLAPERTSNSIAEAINRILAAMSDRELTRKYAEKFSWDETTAGQLEIFKRAIAESQE